MFLDYVLMQGGDIPLISPFLWEFGNEVLLISSYLTELSLYWSGAFDDCIELNGSVMEESGSMGATWFFVPSHITAPPRCSTVKCRKAQQLFLHARKTYAVDKRGTGGNLAGKNEPALH